MEWTASEILEELKKNLRNEDSRIEGSFTMDNLQAVSEVLAMYNGMLIRHYGMKLINRLSRL